MSQDHGVMILTSEKLADRIAHVFSCDSEEYPRRSKCGILYDGGEWVAAMPSPLTKDCKKCREFCGRGK